jgi:hypothetical protein
MFKTRKYVVKMNGMKVSELQWNKRSNKASELRNHSCEHKYHVCVEKILQACTGEFI